MNDFFETLKLCAFLSYLDPRQSVNPIKLKSTSTQTVSNSPADTIAIIKTNADLKKKKNLLSYYSITKKLLAPMLIFSIKKTKANSCTD